MKTIEKQAISQAVMENISAYRNVIEDYFGGKVEDEKKLTPEFKINGRWYQVVKSCYFDSLPDDDEFGWVKKEPKHLYNNENYVIIEQ